MDTKYYPEYGETEPNEVADYKKHKLIVAKMRNNSYRNNVEFTITAEDMYFPTECPVLGIPINYYSPKTSMNSPSFDRVDPKGGYTLDNTRIISQRANVLKRDGTAEEHQRIADYMKDHAEWIDYMKERKSNEE